MGYSNLLATTCFWLIVVCTCGFIELKQAHKQTHKSVSVSKQARKIKGKFHKKVMGMHMTNY
jgi:hypothetical protein